MGRPKKTQPSYLEHKPSGQARVRIDGRDHYLGEFGSPESWQRYNELMIDFAAGRPIDLPSQRVDAGELTIAELVAKYDDFAKANYAGSGERYRIASAVRPLIALYGATPVAEFSPLKLQRVIEKLVDDGDTRKEIIASKTHRTISRTTVNDYLQVLKRLFKWGVSQELVDNGVYQAILTVDGLRRGRGTLAKKAHEPAKVKPVPAADIDAVLKHVSAEIATMIQVQRLCGMRPDEVTIMRPADIDQSARPCWVYRPQTHKNAWREGQEIKEILIGPKARKLLKPWLKSCAADDYLFSPRRVAERWIAKEIREAGKEPTAFVKLNAVRPPRACYDDHSYRQAVVRACRKAKVKKWTPGQLRHNAGTEIRAVFGAEASKLVLGHRHLNTTEIYAEKDRKKYQQIIEKVG
jgi:integrase